MVVFTQEYLKYRRDLNGDALLDEDGHPIVRTRMDLLVLLDIIKCCDASQEDKDRNILEVEVALNGGVRFLHTDVLNDIKAC